MNVRIPFALLFSLFIICPLFIQAQSNYKPAYVVTVAGDTLQGLVDYKEWVQTPATFSFKASEGGNQQVIDAGKLKAI